MNKGFSLIELMMVVAILGGLSFILILSCTEEKHGSKSKSHNTRSICKDGKLYYWNESHKMYIESGLGECLQQ